MGTSTNLGERVRRIRTEQGISREKLAAKAGIVSQTVLRMENGDDPRLSTVRAVADALGVPVGELVA